MTRLGVVSFLNARPLIEGLDARRGVRCLFDVPAALPGRLDRGEVDAALIPVIDVLRGGGRYRVVSDACIGCDGETMTVRVFSQVPPERIHTLWVDPDSHTSVALAQILWREQYRRELRMRPLDSDRPRPQEMEAVLLIGDKVVDPRRGRFAHEVDLGLAWREHTGLPFVFAVWAWQDVAAGGPSATAGPAEDAAAGLRAGRSTLADLLSQARDRGVARAAEIAAVEGPPHGWPVELARRYLTECLTYRLDARAIEGTNLFARWCAKAGLVPHGAQLRWPKDLYVAQAH